RSRPGGFAQTFPNPHSKSLAHPEVAADGNEGRIALGEGRCMDWAIDCMPAARAASDRRRRSALCSRAPVLATMASAARLYRERSAENFAFSVALRAPPPVMNAFVSR